MAGWLSERLKAEERRELGGKVVRGEGGKGVRFKMMREGSIPNSQLSILKNY